LGYIGSIPADKFQTLQKQSFTTSATDTYTLSYAVTNPQDLALFINNVRQNPNDAYTVSGTTLTLSAAITGSDTMYAVFLGKSVETIAPALSSVTNDMLAGSINESKLLGSISNAKLANSSITLNGSAVSLGGSATIGGGKIGQVIQTVSTASSSISTTSFADVMTAAITPSATDSKILIDFRLGGYNPGSAMDIFFRVLRDSTTLQTGTAGQGTAAQSAGTPNSDRGDGGFSINFLDSPNSTSAITFHLQSKVSGSSYTFNSKSGSYSTISTLTLMEVLA
jgi:hypothetical protein